MNYDQIEQAVSRAKGELNELADAIGINPGTLAKDAKLKYGDETVAEIFTKIGRICTWLDDLQTAALQRKQHMDAARDFR